MNLFPAQPFDIDAIMKIERQAFIPPVQEKKGVFDKRLKVFPEGFLILSDPDEAVVRANGGALTCGYLCSELWGGFPDESLDDKAFARPFSLGHNAKHTHTRDGGCLYVSSFALLREYRGRGLGSLFFRASLAALCGSLPSVRTVALLAGEGWAAALRIYGSLGFAPVRTLGSFFPTLDRKVRENAVVLRADAAPFREIELSGGDSNDFSGIRI